MNKRDTSKKRQSILDAAMVAFQKEGFDNTSMDRIAEAAGASKRTVYNHFPSKDELFQAVIDQCAGEMHALKQIRYDPERGLEEQLSDFADAELAVVNNPTWLGFMKVLLTVFIRDPALAQKTLTRHDPGEDSLVSWMGAATQDGRLTVDNPLLAARVFSSMLGGAFTWPAVYQGPLDSSLTVELKRELIGTFLSRYQKRS